MEYYKGYICVTVDELTSKEAGPAVMSMPNYKQQVARKRINVVRNGRGLGGYVLIDFQSLPERFKTAIIAKYGNPEEVIRAQMKGEAVIEDTAARYFYDQYKLEDGSSLSADKIDFYTITASILNEVIKQANDVKAKLRSQGGKGGVSQKECIMTLVESFRDYPGHTLPTSWARLSAKIRDYKTRGYEALIEGYLGNRNTVKINDEMGMYIIALKRSKVPQYNNEQIFTQVNLVADERGWKPIKSSNTITAYLNRPDIMPLWYDAKYGSSAAKHKFARKHITVLPTVRDVLWYGDGTKLNLYYKKFDEKGKAKMATTQVYEVVDAATEVLLGYHISDTEDYKAQYAAYRMAVETAQCRPLEIVNDNQGGHKKLEAMEFFDRISRVSRRTAPDNGSSKTIESIFGRFQAQVLSRDWRFTGMNISAKSESSRPDLEFIMANPEGLSTLEELQDAYAQYREVWNLSAHPATGKPRMEMYLESINPQSQPLTQSDMVDLFWSRTKTPVTFTTSGITISVENKECTYEVYDAQGMPDLNFRKLHTYRAFVVKYDPQDMTTVRLYTEDAKGSLKFVSEASPYFKVHRALYDQKPGEMEFIRGVDQANKQARVDSHLAAVELELQHGVAPEQHGLRRPKVSGVSAKSLEKLMDKSIMNPTPSKPILTLGQINKAISNTTHDQVASGYDKF